jgi:hypothetical protein
LLNEWAPVLKQYGIAAFEVITPKGQRYLEIAPRLPESDMWPILEACAAELYPSVSPQGRLWPINQFRARIYDPA